MSVDKAFREMIRNEIELQLKPLRNVVARLEAGTADLDSLRDVAERLMPFAAVMGPLLGAQPVAAGRAQGRRGPGRPRGSGKNQVAAAGAARRGRKPAAAAAGARACAIVDCGQPARTKG
ncbi:MAG TPA: cell wall protein, partial [Aggregicoccus sp.]|nr:cell wall protein [Aggregicoccus sp.]